MAEGVHARLLTVDVLDRPCALLDHEWLVLLKQAVVGVGIR